MEHKVSFELSKPLADSFKEALNENDIGIRKGLGFEPLSVTVVTLAGVVLVQVIVRTLKSIKYGGIIIDTTKDPLEVRDIPQWERNKVLIITKNDVILHELKNDELDINLLIKLLEKGNFKL